jgi:hypothetical protein
MLRMRPVRKADMFTLQLFAFLCLPFLSLKLPCAIRGWLGINASLPAYRLVARVPDAG